MHRHACKTGYNARTDLCLQLLNLTAHFSGVPVLLQVRSQLLLGVWEHDIIHKGDGSHSALNVQDHYLWGILGQALVPLGGPLKTCMFRPAAMLSVSDSMCVHDELHDSEHRSDNGENDRNNKTSLSS